MGERERERDTGYLQSGVPRNGPSFHQLSVYPGVAVLSFLISYPSELSCYFERLSSPTIPGVVETGVDSVRWKECQLPFQRNRNICIGKGQSVLAKNILTGGSRWGSPHVCWKRWRCTGYRGLPKLGRVRRGWGNLSARCPPYPLPCAHGLPSAAQARPAVPGVATRWQCRSTPAAGRARGLSRASLGAGKGSRGPRGGTCLAGRGCRTWGSRGPLLGSASLSPSVHRGRVWAV